MNMKNAKMESISYKKTILPDLISQLSARGSKDYSKEYHSIYSSIIEIIKDVQFVTAGQSEQIKLEISATLLKDIEKVHSTISSCIDKYLQGAIAEANTVFNIQWGNMKIPEYEEHIEKMIFYRMRSRKEDEKDFSASDLLHIPIDKRHIIKNQRFSINGFPCLYAATSLYQCWEELRRPHLQDLYAAGLLFADDIALLDLRLIRNIKNEKQLKAFMVRLPLIIACSIKTKDDKSTFKAEYIIPQTLLHTILNANSNIDGVLYSSMRKDYRYFLQYENIENCALNENIVIPVKVHYDNNTFVDNLKKIMEISQPLNFEQEIIKGLISFNKTEQYEETIFGQMEQLLMNAYIYKADKLPQNSVINLSQRLKEITNKVTII